MFNWQSQIRWVAVCLGLLSGFALAEPIPKTSFLINFENTGFVNQNGKAFDASKLLGKVVLFNFIYTKCAQVCSLQTHQLVSINEQLSAQARQQITLVSISLDSQFDKPKVLKGYAKKFKADYPNMAFLSGSYDDIVLLQDKLHIFGNPNNPAHPKVDLNLLKQSDNEAVLSNHMTILWVVGKNGQLLQRYSASPIDVKRVETELKLLAGM